MSKRVSGRPTNGTYFQLYSDERGVCRLYEMSIGNGEWRLSLRPEMSVTTEIGNPMPLGCAGTTILDQGWAPAEVRG